MKPIDPLTKIKDIKWENYCICISELTRIKNYLFPQVEYIFELALFSEEQFFRIRNIGRKTRRVITDALKDVGWGVNMSPSEIQKLCITNGYKVPNMESEFPTEFKIWYENLNPEEKEDRDLLLRAYCLGRFKDQWWIK